MFLPSVVLGPVLFCAFRRFASICLFVAICSALLYPSGARRIGWAALTGLIFTCGCKFFGGFAAGVAVYCWRNLEYTFAIYDIGGVTVMPETISWLSGGVIGFFSSSMAMTAVLLQAFGF